MRNEKMCLFCVYIITTPKFTPLFMGGRKRFISYTSKKRRRKKFFFFPFICVCRLNVAATPENENIRISNLNFQVEFSEWRLLIFIFIHVYLAKAKESICFLKVIQLQLYKSKKAQSIACFVSMSFFVRYTVYRNTEWLHLLELLV